MALILAGSIWLDYSIQTGGEAVSYPGTQFASGMLITLVQVPGPITDMPPGWTACSASLIGSAMVYLLVWIDPKEPSQSFARWVISPSPKAITFGSIVYWKYATYASTFGSMETA
jgi:hypothetical protein